MKAREHAPTISTVAAILTIGLLEWQAQLHGVDSWGFGLAIAAISGLGGFTVGRMVGFVDSRRER